MKKVLASILALAAMAPAFVSCEKPNEETKETPAVWSISAAEAFTNGSVTVKVEADKVVSADAKVVVSLDEAASTIPAEALEFTSELTVKAGDNSASTTVTLDDSKLAPGEHKAVFTATVNGEAVNGSATVSHNVLAPGVSVKADEAFVGGAATITVTATKTVVEPITVALTLAEATTVPTEAVTLPESVTIAAGETEATATVEVNLEELKAGEYVVAVDATVGEATSTVEIKAVKELLTLTLKEINALEKGVTINGAVKLTVTYVAPDKKNIFVKDETASGYIYLSTATTNEKIKAGAVIEGAIISTIDIFHGQTEIKDPDLSKAEITEGTALEPAVLTLSELVDNFDNHNYEYVKLEKVQTAETLVAGKTFKITNGDASIDFYANAGTQLNVPAGSTFDVVAIALPYNGGKQIKIWEGSAISGVSTPKVVIEKVWEKVSDASAWITTLSANGKTGTAGTDHNIAVDANNVYVTELGTSKNIWAISTDESATVSLVNTSTVEDKGFDGGNYLSCARVVKKKDGSSVLVATNLFADDDTTPGRMYLWEDGVTTAPRVVTMNGWSSGRRLGDSFSTYGTYEDCWLICGTQTGDGFVTFKIPTGDTSTLISRLEFDCTNFCSYYPFPGNLIKGMFGWRGGTQDDGALYRNRLATIASTEAEIKTDGTKHALSLEKLTTWMGNSENNNGIGFNYFEFDGKRYVAWCMNNASDNKSFSLIIKSGALTDEWDTIINTTGTEETMFRADITGGLDTSWKHFADCQAFATNDAVYIAASKQNVGVVLYKISKK